MNYTSVSKFLRPRQLVHGLLAILAIAFSPAWAADATGTIIGNVTSAGSRNALQGAVVAVPSLGRTVLTDSAGHFIIPNVPPGVVELVFNYTDFEDAKQTVSVGTGAPATVNIAMKATNLVTMEAFTVATVREGQALSITEQRNAPNVKNVIAFDEWGVLPTQNVGELVSRLPGITFTTDEDNLINNVSIRGQPASYTRLNVDGMSTTGVGGDGRSATLHSFSGSMYEQVEIIAGQTPDKRADSLGGQLNLKTRSPLANAERRRVSYAASARYFPSWADRNEHLAGHPLRPDFNASYTEVFDVLGGTRNLGIVIGASYQEVINPHDWDLLQYQNTTNPIAAFRDYDKRSGINDRFLTAVSARADYRWSPTTTISLRFLYNGGGEPFFQYSWINPFYSSSDTPYDPVTNPNGGIMPGFSLNRAEIRPAGNAQLLMNLQKYSFTSKNPTGTLTFEHNWGRLKVDHAYRWSNTHWDSGAGRQRENGQLTMRTRDPIGFILDNSDLNGRVFTQTAGPSVYNASSFTPFVVTAANTTSIPVAQTSVRFDRRDTVTDTNEVTATVNASYAFASNYPITVKAGLDTINRRVNNRNVYPRRWYGVVGSVLSGALVPMTEFEKQMGGQRLPAFEPSAIGTTLGNAALWYEDVNFTAVQQYTNRRIMEEGVDSAYVQGSLRIGNFNVLGGVRGEQVRTEVFTYFRVRTTPIAAEPDHFKRAALDYVRYSKDGKYDKLFPSLHVAYDITSNLKLRASWSNSYGRPALANLVSAPTPNDTARTVSIGNPSIKPQVSRNVDGKLEYYFGSSGILSVGYYEKKITDYIGAAARSGELVGNGSDNGFDGLYGGYELIMPSNIGDATLTGWEFDYKQRLSFLPGLLKGLTARFNYTSLKTEGKFAGVSQLNSNQIAGFIPRAYNVGLQYAYKKFGASYDVNYTGEYPVAYSLTSPGNGNIYRLSLTTMNAGVTWKLRPNTTLFFNVNNITEAGPERYTFYKSRPRQLLIAPQSLKFGIQGQF